MSVASLELCKELYELSGWGYTYHAYGTGKHDLTQNQWYWFEGKRTGSFWEAIKTDFNDLDPFDGRRPTATTHRMGLSAPAYDLGYLLRKLPSHLPEGDYLALQPSFDDEWSIGYFAYGEPSFYINYADTPEDAACKLAIELFKQGVLKKEVSHD